MKTEEWFPRLADIPGVGYQGHPDVDRHKLPQHNAKPKVERFSYAGRTDVSMTWETPGGGSTSQSPAAARASFDRTDASPSQILRRLYEALELPGTATDYHFALLGAYGALWRNHRKHPEVLQEFERLCLLDLKLVETRPEAIRGGPPGDQFVARVPAFQYLVTLYEREGFLDDALGVARRAAALNQGNDHVQRLETRIKELRAEDEG